jgi:hypothetical protein
LKFGGTSFLKFGGDELEGGEHAWPAAVTVELADVI